MWLEYEWFDLRQFQLSGAGCAIVRPKAQIVRTIKFVTAKQGPSIDTVRR
jgi:hypothetical protein